MANKPTSKWSIDKNNNLVPYKKKKENTMTQEAKKQTGNHNVSKSNINNILKKQDSGNSLHGDDEIDKIKCDSTVHDINNSQKSTTNSIYINTSKHSSSSDDENEPVYAINLERCGNQFSESYSESDNDNVCNNPTTMIETNTEKNEDVSDNIHVYTQYTDDSDIESVELCTGKKNSGLKIRMMEPGNGDVVPTKKNKSIEKIPQKSGVTLTQLVSTDVWVGRDNQTITKPKERVPSSNLVTKKYYKKKTKISKK